MKNLFNIDFIKKMSKMEIFLFFGFLIAQIVVSIAFQNTIVNFIIFITNFLYIVCATYKSLWLFIAGTICPFFLAYVCYINGLYGQVILNLLCFVPLQFVGFFNWLKELKKEKQGIMDFKKDVDVAYLSKMELILTVTVFICAFFIVQVLLSKLDGQVMSYADAFVTVGSLFGTILITFRYAENWVVYLAVNIVSAILWLQLAINGSPDAPSLCITQISFISWTIIGMQKWYKRKPRYNKNEVTKGVYRLKD